MSPLAQQTLIHKSVIQQLQTMPKKERRLVEAFLDKFGKKPGDNDVAGEEITEGLDSFYRLIGITPTIFGVIKKPERGNLCLLLCVGTYDTAREWAQDHRCLINSYTGAIQVSRKLTEAQKKEYVPNPFAKGVFFDQQDRNLRNLGVPEELILWVKNLATPEDLSSVYHSLPETVYEALFRLATGTPIEVLLAEHTNDQPPSIVDTEDYITAATNPWTLQMFVPVDDPSFNDALSSPLEAWRVFLHPSQRLLVEKNWHGPVLVLGGAGTGKTVVVIHRAKALVERIFTQPEDRVLVTTFGRNLAADIKARLFEITDKDALSRLDVVNLDQWLSGTLHKLEPNLKLLYNDRTKTTFWRKAMLPMKLSFTQTFVSEEWERVIQAQGIETLEEYLQASRAGRGKPLSEKAKSDLWVAFQAYRESLRAENYIEPSDAMRLVRNSLENGEWVSPYKSVVVDEAQDMGMQALKLLRALTRGEHDNDFLIAGDAHQRIYPRKTSLSKCGINIRGRSRKLKLCYRTPEEIRQFAIHLLEGLPVDDLNGGNDTASETIALRRGTKPEILNFINLKDEVDSVVKRLKMLPTESWKDCCLVVRTSKQLQEYEQHLNQEGVLTYVLPRQNNDNRAKSGLRLATMNRVKGLEFEHIFIAGVNKGVVPMGGVVLTEEQDLQERSLLHVALTRARTSVVVSSYGKPSEYLS